MIDRPGTSLVQQPLQPMTIPGHVVAPTQAVPADQMSRMVHAAVNTVKHWWLIGLPIGFVLAAVACGYIWYTFEPQYRSSATLLIREKPEYIAFNNDTYSRRYLQTQLQLFRTRTVLGEALGDLATIPEVRGSRDPTAYLRSRLGVRPVGQSEFIEVSFTCGSRTSAQQIVTAVVDAYLRHVSTDDDLRTRNIIKRLEEEQTDRKDIVVRMQSEVRDIAGEVSSKQESSVALRGLQSRLIDVDVEIEVSRARLEAERVAVPTDSETLDSQVEQAVNGNAEVQQLVTELEQLDQRISDYEKAVKGDPNRLDPYRRYVTLQQEKQQELEETKQSLRSRYFAAVRESVEQQRSTVIRELEDKIASLETTRGVLESELAKSAFQQQESGGESMELQFRTQDLDRQEGVLSRIGSRIVALKTELGVPGRISLQDKASQPIQPVQQLPWKKLAMALCGAFAAPFGLLFLWEQALRRVGDADALRESNIRVIGEIASLPKGARAQTRNSPSLFEESVDSLRVGLQFSRDLEDTQVVALTSAVSGEGKTCLSAQLAVSMARASNEPTIIIDADIRSPDVADIFEVTNKCGLTDVLDGKTPLEDAVHSIPGLPLDVLPAGPPPKYLQELLGSDSFAKLINDLRQTYRHIIIDTPPLLAASEAVMFARHADAAVLCTMRNHSRGKQVSQAYERLVDAGANPVGVVLNGVAVSYYTRRYGYYNYAK